MIRDSIKRALGAVSTPRLRNALLRAAFASMPEAEKDSTRVQWRIPSMEWSLRRLSRLGFNPHRIVDVGAFQGDWARIARVAFPEARIVMIEAQQAMEAALADAATEVGNAQFVIALLGAESGKTVQFFELETGSSVLQERSNVSRVVRTSQTIALDDVLSAEMPGGANLLKLDVQGYELEVLKGGTRALEAAEAVVAEVSLLPINDGAPLLHDVTAFMRDRGFVAYDICDLTRRPLDLALWQVDILFLKENSALRSRLSYD